MSDETRDYVKCPTFDGKDENWPFFRKKFESYLAQKDLATLLRANIVIPDDSEVGETDAEREAISELQRKNRKAAGVLLNSINSDTTAGQAAFYLVERYHNLESGYVGGHFPNEWNALISRFETVQVKSLRDQKEDYYSVKMEWNEQPSLFIVKLDQMRKKLQKLQYDVDNDDFIQDVLGKLPESKDSNNMNPYEVERKLIDEKIKNDSTYDIDTLMLDLEKVYQEKQKGKENSKIGETGFFNSEE